MALGVGEFVVRARRMFPSWFTKSRRSFDDREGP
jgi:hypothetical protein